jgi:hypothetical protein
MLLAVACTASLSRPEAVFAQAPKEKAWGTRVWSDVKEMSRPRQVISGGLRYVGSTCCVTGLMIRLEDGERPLRFSTIGGTAWRGRYGQRVPV